MVEGRVIIDTMDAFWPRAHEDASLPDYMREYGEIWTAWYASVPEQDP